MAEERVFRGATYGMCSIEEKQALAFVVNICKEQYDSELERMKGKTHWDAKRKRHVQDTPKQGYAAKAVRLFYSNLTSAKNSDRLFSSAVKVAKRCYETYLRGELDSADKNPKKRFRVAGGGRKTKARSVRNALFEWFVDVRTSLHASLPEALFLLQAEKFYEEWLCLHPDIPNEERLRFSKSWIKGWQKEYGVSLKFPNKRISIFKEQCVERIQDYLKNIWCVRRYFLNKFGVDPPIISGDQMPLHRNESSEEATLSFINQDTFVKENHSLCRERITVFTQVSNDTEINILPEFVFKGTGKRPPLLDALPTTKYQWSPKGSYRLEQLLSTIDNLPNRFDMSSHANFAIYVLDDYVVHLMPEVRDALWKRGYVLVIIGCGITEFVQVNDMYLHKQLKTKYREIEKTKMLEKLVETPNEIPTPNRSEVMQMLHQAHADSKVDVEAAFKSTWVTNAFDGSEDYKVSDRIMHLVGKSMREFRLEMMSKPCPDTIQRVIKNLIPPKGIKRANNIEGSELLDGDNIEEKAFESELEDESGYFLEVIDPMGEIPMEVSQEAKHNQPNMMTESCISLVGIGSDDQINKDILFLEKLQKVLDENETSTFFLPYRRKLVSTISEAQQSLEQRISMPRNLQRDSDKKS